MIRILIVDDEVDILDTIVDTINLELGDVDVVCASSANKALTLFSQSNFDLVISDLNMPELSGINLISKLKMISPECPIIVFTGHGGEFELDELQRIGIFCMIKKPYLNELLHQVHSLVNKK